LLVSVPDPLRYDGKLFHVDEVSGIVASMIARGARVLDVGCGTGSLARILCDACQAEVVGIEPDRARASVAAASGLQVHVGCLSRELLENLGFFDVVVFADVLEHLPNPQAQLLISRDALRAGGAVIVSVPNVAHWSVRLEILQGRFRYQAGGIMDATHLRWFTADSARLVLESAGFKVVAYRATAGVGIFENECRAPICWLSPSFRNPFLRIACRWWPNLFGTQHVLRAEIV
jgi:methionine biosynthesis protein MetW